MFWLTVDRSQNTPMIRQVYEQIRLHILQGELRQGERLPSTRDLAENLRVSRNVILEAYDQLIAEGYMTSVQGSGTYVAAGAYMPKYSPKMLSASGVMANRETPKQKNLIDFRFGVPALDLFPSTKWGQLFHQVCASAPAALFGYGGPEGCPELRHTLARYLARSRGVSCEPGQLIITTGAIQGIFIAAHTLLNAQSQVVTEDPMNLNVRKIFSDRGAQVLPVPVDEQGIQTGLIPEGAKPRLIYITPSHQFPLGSTLSIQRRIELVEWARQADAYILEDNYDNEFRFEGTPVSSLQGLDPERVIYAGTFSKILCPALRIGYAVVPPGLIKAFSRLKNLLDHHSPTLDQMVLARFIEQGYFDRHIAKMKKVYRKRRDAIIRSLELHFPGKHSVSGHSTGLHMVVEMSGVAFTDDIMGQLEEAGVRVYPVEAYALKKGGSQNQIMLGYGNVNEEEIREGIRRINNVLAAL